MSRFWIQLCCLALAIAGYAGPVQEALVIANTAYVPLRVTADWLGGALTFAKATSNLTISTRGTSLSLATGRDTATLNGAPFSLAAPVRTRHDITYVPARALARAFSLTLTLDATAQRLQLESADTKRKIVFQLMTVNPVDDAELVWVPSGVFTMGTVGITRLLPATDAARVRDDNDGGRYTESPAHTVMLDGYWIYRHEVTVGQYRKFCQATKRKMPVQRLADGLPIRSVSWGDCTAYARWAGGRLPTEAEWEKAARGPDGRMYPWGDRLDNMLVNAGIAARGEALPVGSFPDGASPYGADDMLGNMREWCADWYDASYYHASPWYHPAGPSSGQLRAIRGGSWESVLADDTLSCMVRDSMRPEGVSSTVGFRLVMAGPVVERSNRPATPIAQIADAPTLFADYFPTGYQCVGAWQADLDNDGTSEVVAIATEEPDQSRPPLLKVLLRNGGAQHVSFIPADEFRFDEQVDGNTRWHYVAGEGEAFAPLPVHSFGIRDFNADGQYEIYVTLSSNGLRSNDEALYLLHWEGKGYLSQIGRILFPDATKGEWLFDDTAREYPGTEIITVGRKIDEEYPAAYMPQWYTFVYYNWNGETYSAYQTRTTRRKYPDSAEAVASCNW